MKQLKFNLKGKNVEIKEGQTYYSKGMNRFFTVDKVEKDGVVVKGPCEYFGDSKTTFSRNMLSQKYVKDQELVVYPDLHSNICYFEPAGGGFRVIEGEHKPKVIKDNEDTWMKKKKVIVNSKQLILINQHWKKLKEAESEFREKVMSIEISLEAATGIDGIEFFMSDNEYVGVGNEDRTMGLIHL